MNSSSSSKEHDQDTEDILSTTSRFGLTIVIALIAGFVWIEINTILAESKANKARQELLWERQRQDREPATEKNLRDVSQQSPCIASKIQQSLNSQTVVTEGAIKKFTYDCASAEKKDATLTEQRRAIVN
jgi:NADH:ubiquinone oxidoreductase subunit 3 (subunit A)